MNSNLEEEKIPLILVVGPTASGKTRLAVDLAKALDGEVVSADSMQIYKYMTIGTAKPTPAEMEGIPHHLIDFLEPGESFSVAQYLNLARGCIADIHARGKCPIVAGGTGLYVSSLVDNLQFMETENSAAVRAEYKQLAQEKGNEHLLMLLEQIDPEYAAKLHSNNQGRVIRALEVYRLTGKTMTWHQAQSRLQPSPYRPVFLGLNYKDRTKLYERIDLRVEQMVEAGLLDEMRHLTDLGFGSTAAQAIGYKELVPYLQGEEPLEVALDRIRQQSRRYAKRQITWFGREERVHWLYPDQQESYPQLLSDALQYVAESGIL